MVSVAISTYSGFTNATDGLTIVVRIWVKIILGPILRHVNGLLLIVAKSCFHWCLTYTKNILISADINYTDLLLILLHFHRGILKFHVISCTSAAHPICRGHTNGGMWFLCTVSERSSQKYTKRQMLNKTGGLIYHNAKQRIKTELRRY